MPTHKCVQCAQSAPPYEKWANDAQGRIFCVGMDAWPTYYLDQAGIRKEFCSAACVVTHTQQSK
jgi:hypothetical protein